MATIPIHLGNGAVLRLGDANGDGRFDLGLGLRANAYGNSPFGFGQAGAELGFNTQGGLYGRVDSSNSNMWGSSGGSGTIFSNGDSSQGSWSNDIFGNYSNSQQSGGYGWQASSYNGGNVYNGNYYGQQQSSNSFESGYSNWGGNSWTGASHANGGYSNIFGQGGQYSVGTPPFVPGYGSRHHHGCGCGSVGRFMGW